MINRLFRRPGIALLILVLPLARGRTSAQSSAVAQDDPWSTASFEAAPETKNRIGLSYRMGLNISVNFEKLGGLALSNPGPAAGSRVNRNYDDGYNRVDSSTNAGALTWNWGYTRGQSLQGDNLVVQSYATPANASSKDQEHNPQNGFEINYEREFFRGKHWRAGMEAALGYMYVSVTDSHTLKNTAYRTNDSFALGGIVAPLAPYNGTFQGPGPLISSSPMRSTDVLARAASITGERDLDANIFTLRLGPYAEVPLTKRLSLFFNGGLTLGVSSTEFSYRETVTISDPTYDMTVSSQKRVGSGLQSDFLIGGYAGGGVEYALTREVSLFAGAQFQAAGQSVTSKNGKVSVLELGQSVLVSIGISYNF